MTTAPTRLGILFLLVAPAGAGKNSLMRRVMKRTDGLRQLPTATTRAPREGEVQGREHLFVTLDDFRQMMADDALLEAQEVHGRYYGVPRQTVEDALDAGDELIADIDYKGATYIRSCYPENTRLIYIQPPNVRTLIERMRQRGDSEAEIARRVIRIPSELIAARECDYLVLNDDIDSAADILYSIVVAERSRRAARRVRRDELSLPAPYTCFASVVPVFGTDVLARTMTPPFPMTTIQPDELPHEAALRALDDTWHIEAAPDHFLVTGPGVGEAIAPASIDIVHTQHEEKVTMFYLYCLPERMAAPAGWRWLAQNQIALPDKVKEALATAQCPG